MKTSPRKRSLTPLERPPVGNNGHTANKPPSPDARRPDEAAKMGAAAAKGEAEQACEAARRLPDVRLDKVAELREAIEDGRYHVESEKIAKKMVDEALLESARQRRR